MLQDFIVLLAVQTEQMLHLVTLHLFVEIEEIE